MPVASILDSAQDVTSLVFALVAFAVLFLVLEGLDRMSAADVVALIVSLGLFVYLLVAMLRPERF